MTRPITVLNVAEKNSVAREVTRLLCNGRPQELPSCATYCKNTQFPFNLNGMPADMIFSSVAGHLLELEFVPPNNKWSGCRPGDLYTAPVAKQVARGEGEKIKRNLQTLARRAQWLVLWLDCDREGENIAFEVIQVCLEVNPRLVVKRARFSALIQRDILHALAHLVEPNANESAAVDARQEIDLRVGSSFTRLQTLLLQNRFDWRDHLQAGRETMLLSYGPCQFPTLGLIVQREWEIQAHVSEQFWSIKVNYRCDSGPGAGRCEFLWRRGRLFDEAISQMYHAACLQSPTATVTEVHGAPRRRAAPVPLCTLEMQKKASQSLRLSGERIMKLAEELYQGGYVSYPRTETTLFAEGYDLQGMVQAQADCGAAWSNFAARLLGGEFRWPKNGGKDDGAHPPIHPTRPFAGDANNPDKARLYEFITRYFLACCAPDAEGQETRVGIEIAEEEFSATGLMVTARNWLDVYPYTSWGGAEALPMFTQGQTFQPAEIRLQDGATQPPPRMRESDLLAKMDAFGIGTDATVADHIAKQLDRGYAIKHEASMTFSPSPLGQALISAYRKMGLANLWMPTLRGIIEQNIAAVARGQRSKDEVLQEAIEAFSTDFQAAAIKAAVLESEVREIVFSGGGAPSATAQGNVNGVGGSGGYTAADGQAFAPCRCGAEMLLIQPRDGRGPIVACSAPPALHAGNKKELSARLTQSVVVSHETCAVCTHGQVHKLHFVFNRALLPPTFMHMVECTCCVFCDQQLSQLLAMVGAPPAPVRTRAPVPSAGGSGSGSRWGSRGGSSSQAGRGRSAGGRSSGGRGGGRTGRGSRGGGRAGGSRGRNTR